MKTYKVKMTTIFTVDSDNIDATIDHIMDEIGDNFLHDLIELDEVVVDAPEELK